VNSDNALAVKNQVIMEGELN